MTTALTERLAAIAAAHTGFRAEAIHRPALRRLVESWSAQGEDPVALADRAAAGSERALDQLVQAVSVGETYFFRHPSQLTFVATEVARRVALSGKRTVRAWSAGCSSGEEAYSLAAVLRAHLPSSVDVSVLGTDILPVQVERATRGVYGRWSVRSSLLHPIVRATGEDQVEVLPYLREMTSFAVHNLLSAALPIENVDLVLCRNVLVYFSPEAGRRAIGLIARSLEKDGVVGFGAVEVSTPPDGFALVGQPELNVYARAVARPRVEPVAQKEPEPAPVPRRATIPPRKNPVDAHVRALHRIEAGDLAEARRLLDTLLASDPDYTPALLERALLDSRGGQRARATKLMHQLLDRLASLAPDAVIAGPEELSVDYYRKAARAFLRLEGGE